MTLRLYNTLTRTIEPFVALAPPRVTVYACGPTVWNYAHVGNFRTFLFNDLLRRYLEYGGHEVVFVMNLTDVDDRIIRQADEAGMSIREYTDRYTEAFFEDCRYLRIRPADQYPRATDYIGPMVDLVSRLLERGLAYRGDDASVYFNVRAFERYGRLSRLDKRALRDGARVAHDDYAKEDAQDFALWKAASGQDERVGAAWDAPFGRGRPGWHLECSAMALTEMRRRFGVETVDIHTGGVDLVFPHHENEIAQSEGATGVPFVRYWLHGEFLMVQGTKMSKRFGNVLTGRDLREEGVSPAGFRMLVYTTHYRQQLNYTDEALAGAEEAVERLGAFAERLALSGDGRSGGQRERGTGGQERVAERPPDVEAFETAFAAALDDDLNAPAAIGAVFTFVRQANRALDADQWTPEARAAARTAFVRAMDVLDLLPGGAPADAELARWVTERVSAREAARAARDFAAADAIREELARAGIELEDTPQGTRWRAGRPQR